MIRNFAYFLVGCLIIVVVAYVCRMMLGLLGMPGGIEQFADVIIGLLGLIGVIYLAYRIFAGGTPPLP